MEWEACRAVEERDAERCPLCGRLAKRVFTPTKYIYCTRAFQLTNRRDDSHLPSTEEEKRVWKERAGIDVDKVQVFWNKKV
jgi:hypothetical protein